MTSRERLLKALKHEPVDRVPVEVRGFDPESELGKLPKFAPISECVKNESDIIHFLKGGGSSRFFFSRAEKKVTESKEEGLRKIYSEVLTPKGALTSITMKLENCPDRKNLKSFIEDKKDLDKLLSLPYAHPSPAEIDLQKKNYYEAEKRLGDRGITQVSMCEPFCALYGYCKTEELYMWIHTDIEMVREILVEICKRICNDLEAVLKAGIGHLFWLCGPELVVPPWVNPSSFDALITEHDSKLFELIHRYKGMVRVHCHGNAMAFLETFRDMGVDALEPLEPPPLGDVNLKEAKKRIGDKVCLCGNLPNLDGLSLEKVDQLCRQAIEEGSAGSGFILTSGGGLDRPSETPEEIMNFVQMVKSGRKYGRY